MSELHRLLKAQRRDLIDGFPARAVLAAARMSKPVDRLNDLLKPHGIEVEVYDMTLPVVANPYLLQLGIIAGRTSKRKIYITLSEHFFDPAVSTVIVKALTFQSVCLHQLVHREQGQAECHVFYAPLEDSMNKTSEIEAMAAGLAHDLQCKEHLSVTGAELLQELSPRLANIMDHSRGFEDSSIAKLQECVKRFS